MKLELKSKDKNYNPDNYIKFYNAKIYEIDSNYTTSFVSINYGEATKKAGGETTLTIGISHREDFNKFILKLKELGFRYVPHTFGYRVELNNITYEEFKIFSQNILDLFKESLEKE